MSLDILHSWGPDNVAQLLVSTLEKRPKKDIADAVFNKIPTFEYLNTRGRVMLDGGASIVLNLEVAKGTATFFDGYDIIPTAANDNFTAAQFKWKQVAVPVAISGREVAQNRGESAIMNLLQMKQKNAEKTLRDSINQKLHNASAPTSTEINALPTLIDATSTIGEIDSSSHSYWQSSVKSGGVFSSVGLADWRNLYNTLRNKGANPDMIITTQSVVESYEATLTPQVRYEDLAKGDAKFRDLAFAGSAVRFDDQCASGVSYFLDSDVLHLYINDAVNFKYNDFVRPPDQDAKVAQFMVMLQLGVSNRRNLGKVTGQS